MIEDYEKTGKLPAVKEIAGKYGVNEASASRMLNNFLAKTKEILLTEHQKQSLDEALMNIKLYGGKVVWTKNRMKKCEKKAYA